MKTATAIESPEREPLSARAGFPRLFGKLHILKIGDGNASF